MIVFLDTNVVLEYLLEREDFYENANRLFELAYSAEIPMYISSLSVANIAYVARKNFSREILYDIITDLRKVISFTNVDDLTIQRALILRANDFEDAIQYFSALQAGADCIVTRNVKDFSFSDIEVITPSDFLTKYFP